MRKLGILIVLTITVTISYGQQHTLSGTLTSAYDGKPVAGVRVILLEEKIDTKKNEIVFVETKTRTRTNKMGQFELIFSNPRNKAIRFKKRPYSTSDVKLDNRTVADLLEFNYSMTMDVR